MKPGRWLLLAAFLLSACAPAATSAPAPAATQAPAATSAPAAISTRNVAEQTAATQAPAPTRLPPGTATASPQTSGAAATAAPTALAAATEAAPPTVIAAATVTALPVEPRVVEVEWPARLRLGDSDSVRLALIPSANGYTVTTEFPDNTVLTSTVTLTRPEGYTLFAAARLQGAGFQIDPAGEQVNPVPAGAPVTWRWTLLPQAVGQHRLIVDLRLRWISAAETRETQLYSKALTVEVVAWFGLTAAQAAWAGLLGLIAGGSLTLAALISRRPRRAAPQPNAGLALEPPPGLSLSAEERGLLQTLFHRYARVVLESEFRSGYSGARTLLALPVRPDGRADAHTIVKLGAPRAIQREYLNYEAYVKDTLPPMTARIQEPPVAGPAGALAAVRYTFIAEPGQRPLSLREALLRDPDPALLTKLFETFGPHWWLQRRPHTFRAGLEYDRLLPAHLVLEPVAEGRAAEYSRGLDLGPATAPGGLDLKAGDVVRVARFAEPEVRPDGRSLSLNGLGQPGQPPLRVRWQSLKPPDGTPARVTATRAALLREAVAGLDLLGLPDPLPRLPALLNETVAGSQSVIHGDLNLENVLTGPGGFVWLIDFARTRDGHPLFDFAHLTAEIIAHVIAPQVADPAAYREVWRGAPGRFTPLLGALKTQAGRCLANPSQPREYDLAVTLACLGALKHPNVDARGRHFLYLTAAFIAQTL